MPKISETGTVLNLNAPNLNIVPKTDGKRRTSDWLAAFLDHTAELESPDNYLRWAGLSTIAAVAQRKIFRDTQAYTVYPNLYVWLVGPPGTKKSTAIRAGRRLLKDIPTVYLTPDAPSVVGIMQEFKEVAEISKAHQSLNGFVYELSTLFENAQETIAGFLNAIYDGDADYIKRTRIGGKEHIPFPWFNLVAGTTPRWMGDNLKANATEGGLLARTVIVFSDEQNYDSPEPSVSPAFRKREETLQHDLAYILTLNGQFDWAGGKVEHGNTPCTPSCGCGDAYKWYDDWYRNPQKWKPGISDNRTASYYVRKPMHLLKVAMLLSLGKGDDMTFKVTDLESAESLLKLNEKVMKRAFSAVGNNPFATDWERMNAQIRTSKQMTYAELVASNYHNLEPQKLEATLASLVAAGYVEKRLTKDGYVYLHTGKE